jgi:hypothetical protein
LVDVTANNTWLTTTTNQVFKNLNIEVLTKTDYIKLGLDTVKHTFQISSCLLSFFLVSVKTIGEKYHQQLPDVFRNNRFSQQVQGPSKFCPARDSLFKLFDTVLEFLIFCVGRFICFASKLNQSYFLAVFSEKLFT